MLTEAIHVSGLQLCSLLRLGRQERVCNADRKGRCDRWVRLISVGEVGGLVLKWPFSLGPNALSERGRGGTPRIGCATQTTVGPRGIPGRELVLTKQRQQPPKGAGVAASASKRRHAAGGMEAKTKMKYLAIWCEKKHTLARFWVGCGLLRSPMAVLESHACCARVPHNGFEACRLKRA